MQAEGHWQEAGAYLARQGQALEAAGADFLVLCTNTMHKVADAIEAACGVPLLHLADATAEVVVGDGLSTVGLLGTAFTMEQDFYTGRLEARGLSVVVPMSAVVRRCIASSTKSSAAESSSTPPESDICRRSPISSDEARKESSSGARKSSYSSGLRMGHSPASPFTRRPASTRRRRSTGRLVALGDRFALAAGRGARVLCAPATHP